MHSTEVRAHLKVLALSPSDAARLFGVGLRTVRRWTQPEPASTTPDDGPLVDPGTTEPARTDPARPERAGPAARADTIPGPAEQALRAWLKLQRIGAHWRPDGLPLGHVDPAGALARVRERSGPRTRWDVDLLRYCASMGGHRVSFVWPGRAPGSASGPAFGTASGAPSEAIGWALQSYCPERSEARAAGAAGGPVSVEALAELVDDACASIARRLAGERAPRPPVLVMGEPAWVGDAVELRDESFSPSVVCRLGTAALAAFLELPAGAASGITPAQLLGFSRRHHATLTELAGELHARPSRGTTPPGSRLLDIGAGDLGLVRAQLGWPAPGAAPGAVLGPPAGVGRDEMARAPATAVAVAESGEGA
jgi:hypothetical protein